ncbi:MAG: hypothetical protein ACRD2H_09590 [Terriglobales bacterium]
MQAGGNPLSDSWDGFNPGGFWKGTFVVLRGYIDESYDDQTFTLACLSTDPLGWLAIVSRWKKALARRNRTLLNAGRPRISRYHSSDFNSSRGEYSGWSEEEKAAFAKELVAALGTKFTYLVAYTVPLTEFAQIFPEDAGNRDRTCYSFLLQWLMLEIGAAVREARHRGPVRNVEVVLFHDWCQFNGSLLAAFEKMVGDQTFPERDLFSTIAPRRWQDTVALQPADLIAYETFKEASRRIRGRARRKSFQAILDLPKLGGRSRIFDRNSLLMLRERLEKRPTLEAAEIARAAGAGG